MFEYHQRFKTNNINSELRGNENVTVESILTPFGPMFSGSQHCRQTLQISPVKMYILEDIRR